MKRVFLSMSLLLAVGVTNVQASSAGDPGDKVKASFAKEFAGAQSVEWTLEGDYISALFVLNRHRVIAYFNTTGELQGYARGISFNELPLVVTILLDKHFSRTDFTDILEITN